MIAALYSSRVDGKGTNAFDESGVVFGWEPIEDMLHRGATKEKQSTSLGAWAKGELRISGPLDMAQCETSKNHASM